MNFLDAYLLSPGSILVGVVTIAFLVNGAWGKLQRQKTEKFAVPTDNHRENGEISVSKEPDVPSGWWDSPDVFELERRALFSKTWIYLANSTQFPKRGAYQSFDLAGYPVFLIRGKDDMIRAFHNVCRHRAYTITQKEIGASTVLGCRYHGWSYDTYGKLVKAPKFEDVPGFVKSENSLFEIHTHTTERGWVFVNLNAGEPAAFKDYTSVVLEGFARGAGLGRTFKWVTGQTLTGTLNWKFGNTSHFTDLTEKLEKRISETLKPSFATQLVRAVTQKNNQAKCSIFPTTFIYSFEQADLCVTVTFLPKSEKTTQIRYDLFDSSSKAETDENALANSVGDVLQNFVKDLEIDFASVDGRSSGSSSATCNILKEIQEHQKLEKMNGGQILPAMRQPKGSSLFQKAEQLCKELDCSGPGSNGNGSGGLDW
ncbi:hypothetical protein N7478_011042 [Penicillium angulare]|uniref:uncharacterized protein n=1 Tax=Penicillium angulare TaxID=116970 RepID=UPI0025414C76|nr:uncharacterized protein N7478_011042 [Penicillium angulare]KAJ5263437.1 hypothetical protein N7478_011042 [Penicillium angulare]